MKRAALAGFLFALCIGCESSLPAGDKSDAPVQPPPKPEATKPIIPSELMELSAARLCARLAEIKVIPTFEPTPTDPVYEALVAKRDEALPCLIKKVTDTTVVPDPRYSVPVVEGYAVGDTAVFILLEIADPDPNSEKLYKAMLPPKYRARWESDGIYAYFDYVSKPKNRKELQGWWLNWRKNRQRGARLPL